MLKIDKTIKESFKNIEVIFDKDNFEKTNDQ